MPKDLNLLRKYLENIMLKQLTFRQFYTIGYHGHFFIQCQNKLNFLSWMFLMIIQRLFSAADSSIVTVVVRCTPWALYQALQEKSKLKELKQENTSRQLKSIKTYSYSMD